MVRVSPLATSVPPLQSSVDLAGPAVYGSAEMSTVRWYNQSFYAARILDDKKIIKN